VALLKSTSRPTEAIGALVDLLETSPTDVEAWCELSDLYQSQGLGLQAIFSLEEALLITPNAWNVGLPPNKLDFFIADESPAACTDRRAQLYHSQSLKLRRRYRGWTEVSHRSHATIL
jgi:tetratricopeptide (TPR) repeat protein